MASFCAHALVAEISNLVQVLRQENHPAVERILPFFRQEYIEEVRNCWATLDCIRQELSGLRHSIQNLTVLLVSQQQQLIHPSNCTTFSTFNAPSPVVTLSIPEQPTKKARRPSKRTRKDADPALGSFSPPLAKKPRKQQKPQKNMPAVVAVPSASSEVEDKTTAAVTTAAVTTAAVTMPDHSDFDPLEFF